MCGMFELGLGRMAGPRTGAKMSAEKLDLKEDGIDGGYFGGDTCASACDLERELRAEGPTSASSCVQ